MPFDPVPWFVGGGAQHSPEVARLLAYAATNGAEGVVGVNDLKVRQLTQPGPQVRVALGAGLALNRSASSGQQTYVVRAPSETVVDVASTGVGAGRSDLVIARVEDPYLAGSPYPDPPDVTVGPYVAARIVSGVPASTLRVQDVPGHAGDTAVTLARLDIPGSTTNITDAMIVDLREMAVPREHYELRAYAIVTDDTETLTSEEPTYEVWPNAAANGWQKLHIPSWATRLRITMTWAGVLFPPGNVWGFVKVNIGGGGTQTPPYMETQAIGFDGPNNSGNVRMTIVAADDISVPETMRGLDFKVYPMGYIRAGSPVDARPIMDKYSALTFQAFFLEDPV